MGYYYLNPSILFKKKKEIGVGRSLFYNWTFLKNILRPFGIGKAIPRFVCLIRRFIMCVCVSVCVLQEEEKKKSF